jgi:hypothetical protein
LTMPGRMLRAARHARYHVAVWIRGEAAAGMDGRDGRG